MSKFKSARVSVSIVAYHGGSYTRDAIRGSGSSTLTMYSMNFLISIYTILFKKLKILFKRFIHTTQRSSSSEGAFIRY